MAPPCTPRAPFDTRVYTRISFQLGPWNRLAKRLLPPYTREVIRQDVVIMKNQGENLRRWGGEAVTAADGKTTTTFEFEPLDDGAHTLVTITESSWQVSPEGARGAFGNCEGWTGMLAALKMWVEHGISLRDGFYA